MKHKVVSTTLGRVQLASPILYTRENVQAIRDGRKTQTRRIMVPQVTDNYGTPTEFNASTGRAKWNHHDWEYERFCFRQAPHIPNDLLWVKETVRYRRYGSGKGEYQIAYDDEEKSWPTLSGRFMSRRFSRFLLRVTELRLQRLQEISDNDCAAEGMPPIRAEFMHRWDKINKGRILWAANPWVWVYTFEVIQNPS